MASEFSGESIVALAIIVGGALSMSKRRVEATEADVLADIAEHGQTSPERLAAYEAAVRRRRQLEGGFIEDDYRGVPAPSLYRRPRAEAGLPSDADEDDDVTGVADRGTAYTMSSEALIGLTPSPAEEVYEGPETPAWIGPTEGPEEAPYEGPETPVWIGPTEGPEPPPLRYTKAEAEALMPYLKQLEVKSTKATRKLGKKAIEAAEKLAIKTGSEKIAVVKGTAKSDSKRDVKAATKRVRKEAAALQERTGLPAVGVVTKPGDKKASPKKTGHKKASKAAPAKRAPRKGKLVRTYKKLVCTPSGAELRKVNVRKKLRRAA